MCFILIKKSADTSGLIIFTCLWFQICGSQYSQKDNLFHSDNKGEIWTQNEPFCEQNAQNTKPVSNQELVHLGTNLIDKK